MMQSFTLTESLSVRELGYSGQPIFCAVETQKCVAAFWHQSQPKDLSAGQLRSRSKFVPLGTICFSVSKFRNRNCHSYIPLFIAIYYISILRLALLCVLGVLLWMKHTQSCPWGAYVKHIKYTSKHIKYTRLSEDGTGLWGWGKIRERREKGNVWRIRMRHVHVPIPHNECIYHKPILIKKEEK